MPDKQSDELKLWKWVRVSKEKFNEILNIITKAKSDGLKTDVDGREITLDNTESLLKGIASGKINGNEFKREYNIIVDDVKAILQKSMLTRSQEKIVEILSLPKEIPKSKDEKTDEQPDIAYMPELEKDESAEKEKNQRGQGLKILTLNQMFSGLPISFAQLKAGNNSENLKSDPHLPKNFSLFVSMIANQKWWKIFLFHLNSSFHSQCI